MYDNLLIEYFNVLEDVYDKFMDISKLSRDDEDFYRLISEIESLFLLEEDYINKFPKNISFLNDLSFSVHNFYRNDDYDKQYFVLLRFDNILEVLKADAERETISTEILDDEFCDSYESFNNSREFFMRDFISNTSLDFGYLSAFTIKEISDELILNNFNLCKIKMIDFNEENYFDYLAIETRSLIINLISLSEFANNSLVKKYNTKLLKFMLLKLRDFDFEIIRNDFENDNVFIDNISYPKILKLFENAFELRSEQRKFLFHYVDMDSFDGLVSLIKLEEFIFNKISSLNVFDLSSLNSISSLLRYEQDVISKLNIEECDAEILYNVISCDINFFLVNDYSSYISKLISRRIINLLPIFQSDTLSGTIGKTYKQIIKNHIINSLCEYKKIICDIPFDEDVSRYIKVYINIIFEYPEILNDIIFLNYDFSTLFCFDDEFNSNMLGLMNPIDYSYDKDNLLFNLAKNIINELYEILVDMENNPELVSLYEFKICEFNDIINSVSTEHLCFLYEYIDTISNNDVKKILHRKIDYAYKY